MLQLLLFLHVLGAIVVFGPTFAFPLIARQAQLSPQNSHFAAIVTDVIERRIIIPGAIVQGITGVLLIIALGADLTSPSYRWLITAIVLYLIAIGFAIFVQAPAVERMVELTKTPPGPGGPPPELLANAKKLQRGGMLLALLIVAIVFLMVVKPGV
jgi:uncharacterized membrane protein